MAEVHIDAQSMTAEELKARLYHSFREKGLVDSLKSQLRTKLVKELHASSTKHQPTLPPSPSSSEADETPDKGPSSLAHRAANSLVADHLRRCRYEYSLAVFLPESETSKDKMFTIHELLSMSGIHPDSKLFRRVTENVRGYHPKGLLWQLLRELMPSQARSQEKAIQVDNVPAHHDSIEKKLTAVDDLFAHEVDGYHEGSNQALQAKLISFQRKMDASSKEEVTREICRFKESEAKRIELDEREKCRQEIAKARREMESTYQAKVAGLQERERSMVERIQRHQDMVERETYSQRQSLLDELQTLKQKEAELKREADLHKRAVGLEESRRKTVEESLKMREASLATIEETYDKRFKEQIRQHDIEQQVKLTERVQEIEKREARLREQQERVQRERESLSGLKEELKERKSRIAELEHLHQQSRYESVAVSKRYEVLSERLKDMVDYHSVKEDNAVLRHELHNEKQRCAQAINEHKMDQARHEEALMLIQDKLGLPSPQTVTMQAELQRTRVQLEQERNVLQHKEAQYRATVQDERDRNTELGRQLDDQAHQMREMNSQIADLRQTLRQTQQALSNEIYRKPSASTGQVADLLRSPDSILEQPVHDSLIPEDHYVDTTLRQTRIEHHILLAGQGAYGPITDFDSDHSELSPNASLAFLEGTKARFQQLEREAESLEQNYHNFQHRVTNVHVLPVSPPLYTHSLRLEEGRMATSPNWHVPARDQDSIIQTQPVQPPLMDNGRFHQLNSRTELKGTIPMSFRGATDPPVSTMLPRTTVIHDQLEHNGRSSKPQGPPPAVESAKASPPLPPHASVDEFKTMKSSAEMDDMLSMLRPPSPATSIESSPRGNPRENESLEELLGSKEKRRELDKKEVLESQENDQRVEEALRFKREEEEREEREWEERRRKWDEERRLKEQEAREREQAMLEQLQRQEGNSGPTPNQEAVLQRGSEAIAEPKEATEHPHGAPQEGTAEDKGLKIDPVMQRYMQMVQDKKQQDPQQGKPSPVNTQSETDFDVAYDLEGADQPSSAEHVSETSDPFDDW